MALQKRIVGRLPLFFGAYKDSSTYQTMNRVSYYGSEFQVDFDEGKYTSCTGIPPFNKETLREITVEPEGYRKWVFELNKPWIIVSDLVDAYKISEDFNKTESRLRDLERNTLDVTLSANPYEVFYKDRERTIDFTAKLGRLGDLQPPKIERVDINYKGNKINTDNEMSARYTGTLTDSDNIFSVYIEYYGTPFTSSINLSSRYPVYIKFAEKTAVIPDIIDRQNDRVSARTSAAGSYTFTNNAGDGCCPYLIVPFDVNPPRGFSMGGAPVDSHPTGITIDGISYTSYRLGSDNGYPSGVTLNILATA